MSTRSSFSKRICVVVALMVGLCLSFTSCSKEEPKEEVNVEPAVVTSDNRDDYNFSEEAMRYLDIIGTEYVNRNLSTEEGVVDSENKHEAAKDWIVSELKNAGFEDDYLTEDEFECNDAVNGKGGTNILAKIPGKDESKQVIIGAHYDGDGTGDNGTSVALLLANACGLAKEKPQYTIKIVFFDGEELGMLGSTHYVENITKEDKENTLYMVNMDSLGFGDYCNMYGGSSDEEDLSKPVVDTEAYDFAMEKAKALGFKTYGTKDLDGYFAKNGEGPAMEADAVYTNPWTDKNQPPANFIYASPSTGDWSDHVPFKEAGIKYVYFEATDWYAKGDGGEDAYTGYFDTNKEDLGENGMFMNTKYDTLENLNKYFPGRAEEHFNLFSPILSALMIDAGGVQAVESK